MSIIQELSTWAKQNSAILASRGAQLTEKFPEPGSAHPWKASVALAYGGVIVSYTVWERTRLQTELIVMNTHTGKTVVMDEGSPNEPKVVVTDMDAVVKKLLDGVYRQMKPDPKLTIS